MAAPQLFYVDPATIVSENKALYESLVGRTILPAQPEMQIILAFANREMLYNARGDYALSQVLLSFSNSPMLDYLAENAGVKRLAASPAETKLQFTLTPGHGSVTIPAGSRVSTLDGKIYFATDEEVVVAPGTDVAELNATATTDGSSGNGYGAGTVNEIIDPLPFVASAVNLTVTAAGSEQETDEGLRERVKQAPSQYSTAGSVGSYKYHAFSANPQIIDVAVTSPEPGQVNVYPLVKGGIVTPDAILDAVEASVSADFVRPLTDTVEVLSPTKIEYDLEINIILKYGVTQSTTVDAVTAAVTEYCLSRAESLGQDVTVAQLIQAAMNGGAGNVHSLNFDSFTDLAVDPTSFPVCTGIAIGSVTYEDPDA